MCRLPPWRRTPEVEPDAITATATRNAGPTTGSTLPSLWSGGPWAAWIGYTVAGEKMPWLLTHMALPMCVLGGWWLGHMLRHVDWRRLA